jgi:hypothetical protein
VEPKVWARKTHINQMQVNHPVTKKYPIGEWMKPPAPFPPLFKKSSREPVEIVCKPPANRTFTPHLAHSVNFFQGVTSDHARFPDNTVVSVNHYRRRILIEFILFSERTVIGNLYHIGSNSGLRQPPGGCAKGGRDGVCERYTGGRNAEHTKIKAGMTAGLGNDRPPHFAFPIISGNSKPRSGFL